MSVNSVIKPLGISVLFKIIKGFTLERETMNVTSVGNLLRDTMMLKCMREATLERNPMFVSSVGKPSLIPVPFKP